MIHKSPFLTAAFLTLALCTRDPASAQSSETTRLSVSLAGIQGDGDSAPPSISADGRYIAFQSYATNLVAGEVSGAGGIFERDRLTGVVWKVSVDSAGNPGTAGDERVTSISADGRYVAFSSFAINLVPGDTNGFSDVFVHDSLTGATRRFSVSSNGVQGNNNSTAPSISADGRYVAFTSQAKNLVSGDTNSAQIYEVFVHDGVTGQTVRASVTTAGVQANKNSYSAFLSADGHHVAFASLATNLVPGDTNNERDAFERDLVTGTTTRVSVGAGGLQANGLSVPTSISADGRYVAFHGSANNLVPGDTNLVWDIFVHDGVTGVTDLVSVDSAGHAANLDSLNPALSPDGRFVAFMSSATNLVPGDGNGWSDVFLHDRVTGATERISVASDGTEGDYWADMPAISADGRFVTFESASSNLVPDDTNASVDAFLRDLHPDSAWSDFAPGLAGSGGIPSLAGAGTLVRGTSASLALTAANPSSPALLFVSLSSAPVPFKGGSLAAFPVALTLGLGTDASGAIALPFTWPSAVPPLTTLFFQCAVKDAAGPQGASLSNALKAVTP